jgi:hypothetical protein
MIFPVKVPAAREATFTETVMASGVTQQPVPVGLAVSQLPPLEVEGVTLKFIAAPVLPTVTTCGSGLAPLATAVNDSGGIL